MLPTVQIVGAGVSGLTVGIELLEAGYSVNITTEKMPADTTSARAAAVWFPYAVEPRDKVSHWSKVAYHRFQELCEVPNSGVSMTDLTVLIEREADAWWKDALPAEALRPLHPEELPPGAKLGYLMRVPLAETQLYLDYLLDQYRSKGGKLRKGTVKDLAQLVKPSTVVVNCSGLGARELNGDKTVYPIRGQIIKADVQEGMPCVIAEYPIGEKEDEVAYVIPRRDCMVLGGTASVGDANASVNPDINPDIIERCRVIAPQLEAVTVREVVVGLRPGRPTIRLERETPDIIHNYGHGGGGFTVSWGCARAVLDLIKTPRYRGSEVYDDADFYQTYLTKRAKGSSPNETLEEPIMDELIGNCAHQRILDLGCGDGRYGRKLLHAAAGHYHGVDGSKNMIESATTNLRGKQAELTQAMLEELDLPPATYDLVISRLALHYLEDLDSLLERVYDWLRPGGRFIFSVEHPLITSHYAAYQGGKKRKRKDWIVDNYFLPGPRVNEWNGKDVVKYHRTLEEYYGKLKSAGLRIDDLRESKPQAAYFSDTKDFERRRRIPLFLFFVATRP